MTIVNFDWDEIEDNIVEEYDDAGVTVAEYTTEPEEFGNVVSQYRNGQDSYFHYDGQGSTLALTDFSGNITDEFAYSAFGVVTERTGNAHISLQYVGRHGYYRDVDCEIIDVRRRAYHPRHERWLTCEPVPRIDGGNLYVYCRNTPNHCKDPSGRRTICCAFDTGWLVTDRFRMELECPKGKSSIDCCYDYGSPLYRLWNTLAADDRPCATAKFPNLRVPPPPIPGNSSEPAQGSLPPFPVTSPKTLPVATPVVVAPATGLLVALWPNTCQAPEIDIQLPKPRPKPEPKPKDGPPPREPHYEECEEEYLVCVESGLNQIYPSSLPGRCWECRLACEGLGTWRGNMNGLDCAHWNYP